MPQEPSPWMEKLPTFNPSSDASFVEYLRWMRVPLSNQAQDNSSKIVNSGTVLELFERFEDNDWSDYLNRLTQRTTRLASIHFKVSCPWRIRVGGTKGPESMLLPAFDALGMPYIPSCTLRGIARAMASQDKNMSPQEVNKIFGCIEPEPSMGQVIFMDAYPLPGTEKQGGLSPDMANQIWKWENNKPPEYKKPNPNICISLEKPTFIIGLRKTKLCSDETLTQVRDYLIKGLCQGIGSRVNTGYGTLYAEDSLEDKIIPNPEIIQIDFKLYGQLIHGRQNFNSWRANGSKWKPPGKAQAEVRPTAFRSILRYWFRALALGVLQPASVRQLELEIFGGIEPKQHTGLFRVEVTGEVKRKQSTHRQPGLLTGSLTLRHNTLSMKQRKENRNKFEALQTLLKTLTWLMFHLGGVGQGARRPCYQRFGDNPNPSWRGSDLFALPQETDCFWNIPSNISEFQQLFRQHLITFYNCLETFSGEIMNLNTFLTVPALNGYTEAVDKNCEIIVCRGFVEGNKGFALSILHGHEFKIEKNGRYNYDRELCGSVKPQVIPSPIWIRELDYIEGVDFQVVTVFGAKTGKREAFLDKLQQRSGQNNFLPIFPL